MKKTFILGLAILLFAGLLSAACQKNGGGEEEDNIMNGIAPDPGGDFDYAKVLVQVANQGEIVGGGFYG